MQKPHDDLRAFLLEALSAYKAIPVADSSSGWACSRRSIETAAASVLAMVGLAPPARPS
jgi:hypothetical protein